MGDLASLLDAAFEPDGPIATTYAVVVVQGGEVVAERYGGALPRFDGPPVPVLPETPLLSWSVAKSMLHAVVGMLVADRRLDLDAPAPVPSWADDERSAITLEHLLTMRDGLRFAEDYVDAGRSDVMEMLFGAGKDDVAAFAEDRPLAAPPGTTYSYSSGTSNIVSGIVARVLGPGAPYRRFLDERLFGALGTTSAVAGFDGAGTWVASSYVHATARDFARFGSLYLADGMVGGRRLLPEGWVDHGIRPRSEDVDGGAWHGAHWWRPSGHEGFEARGFEGQSITVVPAAELVVVRLGCTPAALAPALRDWRADVVAAVR